MLALTALVFAAAALGDETSSPLAPSDWHAVRAAHADARHAVDSSSSAHAAFNHAQALRVHFAHGVARLESKDGEARVAFELERWGRADAFADASDELAVRATGRRFERAFSGGLVE